MLGGEAFGVALAWLVLQQTGSVAALATVMLVRAVPCGVLMLLGGAVTDRLAPRRVMLASHLLCGLAVGAVSLLTAIDKIQVWHLYSLSILMGVTAAFVRPAAASVLPLLLPAEHLPRGNALQGVAEQTSMIAGPMLGGLVTVWLGPAAAIGFNAVTFFVAATTACCIPRRARANVRPMRVATLLTEIGEGLQTARHSREIRTVLLIISAATLSYSGVFAVGLPALAGTFSEGAVALGTLVSAWGVGQLLGTLSAAITGLPRRWGLLVISMTLVEAVAFALLGISPHVVAAVAILVPLGFGVAYSTDVALPAFVQTRTPGHLLGRISSLLDLPHFVFEPISIAVLGFVLSRSVSWGFAAAAIPMLAVGVRLLLDPNARRLSIDPPVRSTYPDPHLATKDDERQARDRHSAS